MRRKAVGGGVPKLIIFKCQLRSRGLWWLQGPARGLRKCREAAEAEVCRWKKPAWFCLSPELGTLCSSWVAPWGFVLDAVLVLAPAFLGGLLGAPGGAASLRLGAASFEQPRSTLLLGSSGFPRPSQLCGVPWGLDGRGWWGPAWDKSTGYRRNSG